MQNSDISTKNGRNSTYANHHESRPIYFKMGMESRDGKCGWRKEERTKTEEAKDKEQNVEKEVAIQSYVESDAALMIDEPAEGHAQQNAGTGHAQVSEGRTALHGW